MGENNVPEEITNFADKTLAELSDLFRSLMDSPDRMARSKEAEAIKASFYKLLVRLRSEAAETAGTAEDAFAPIEENFKAIFSEYKAERAKFAREQEAEREANLQKKQAVIDELKALVEGTEQVNFPVFRELQARWRNAGPVPVTAFRDINDTYQFYVEKFYDMVEINRDLRDLDFKKNLEAKQAFCEAAEKLAENENVVAAFAELQKLHEQWKDFGPVAREFRDDIWNRFKAATAVVNKRYQAHFEEQKARMEENLARKDELCRKAEDILARKASTASEMNALSREIEELKTAWRGIGFATRKENQKIYDRFRAACDSFYARKKEFYSKFKATLEENLERKKAILERAEALKDSTDWKKTTDELIGLQKEWKEIGAVPGKKSEQIWEKFRAACDSFFENKKKHSAPRGTASARRSPREDLIRKYNALQQDIATYENNIGFFAASKNAEPLIQQMREKIEEARKELKEMELKLRQSAEEEKNG